MGLTGEADSVMVMGKARGRGRINLFCTGRDVEEQELALEFSIDGGYSVW